MEEGLIYNSSISLKLNFSDLFHRSIQHGFGCAIYRLPKHDEVHMIIDCDGGQNLENVHIESLEDGYIIHPFSAKKHSIKYLKKDIHIIKKGALEPELLHSKLNDDELTDYLAFSSKENIKEKRKFESYKSREKDNDEGKISFLGLINNSLDQIRNDNFQKVVLSRTKNAPLHEQFNPVELFEILNDKYRNAFVHLTYVPGIGIWTGATPETLISVNSNNQFQTVALAATQAYNAEIGLEETTWSQKDIEEQAMVSRYIINCFKKIRLREFEEIGPRSYLSGNLVHLKTNYLVNMEQVNFPDLGSVMLDLLHPTSAVCGMPKDITMAHIEEHEGFDREYFSGYLGPVNVGGETNIFVNLRCAKLKSDHAQLFAGAGIISNSNPEKEWKETEIKMETILSAIKEL